MNEPIFRYIVVLLAAIVMIRIVLSINFEKKPEEPEDKSQPGEILNESENQVDQTGTAEFSQEVSEDDKIKNSKVKEDDNE